METSHNLTRIITLPYPEIVPRLAEFEILVLGGIFNFKFACINLLTISPQKPFGYKTALAMDETRNLVHGWRRS